MARSKKIIAIAFSDLHINDWSKFNANGERTQNHFRVLSLIKEKCMEYRCPAFFCGDLFHKPELITIPMISQVQHSFSSLEGKWEVYAISGNHDMISTNSFENPQESWVSIFSEWYHFLINLDFNKRILDNNLCIWGIPYIDHNIGLNQWLKEVKLETNMKNILLLHTDYPGAKDTDGTEVGSCENLNTNLLQKFDLVLIGHIHKPQRLGKKIIIVGAPIQQRRSDKDCDLGYWKIYEDLTVKFVPLDFPKFIDVDSEDKVKDDGNYYTIISKSENVRLEELPTISRDLSKRKIVRSYLKAKGIKDPEKKKLLTNLIKEADE